MRGAGSLHKVLTGHQGPVFSLKYSKNGAMLLSGSVDKSVIVWDTKTGTMKQHVKQHEGAVLDVSWRTDTSFATCSTDKTIHIYKLDRDTPLRRLTGHHGEVNCINWAPSGKLLASCSDDCTAKIWSLTSVRGAFYLFLVVIVSVIPVGLPFFFVSPYEIDDTS